MFTGKEGVIFFNKTLQGSYWELFEWVGMLRIGPEAIWKIGFFSCGPPIVGFEKDLLWDAIDAGIPNGTSAINRMANSMSLPYFCLRKLVQASVTSMTGSPCCTHGRKLILGANAIRNPWPFSIVVVCTLWLPANGLNYNLDFCNISVERIL